MAAETPRQFVNWCRSTLAQLPHTCPHSVKVGFVPVHVYELTSRPGRWAQTPATTRLQLCPSAGNALGLQSRGVPQAADGSRAAALWRVREAQRQRWQGLVIGAHCHSCQRGLSFRKGLQGVIGSIEPDGGGLSGGIYADNNLKFVRNTPQAFSHFTYQVHRN